MTFAQQIRNLRMSKNLSIPEAAACGGVNPATLRRWEKVGYGKLPRLVDLRRYLTALRATDAEQAAVLAFHSDSAYRALQPEQFPLARSGELWRALRLRQGIGVREMAKILGMDAGTLAHWESGRYLPDAYWRARMLDVLSVSSQEHEVLLRCSAEVTLPPLAAVSLDSLWQDLDALREPVHRADPAFPGDLALLALIGEAARRCPTDPHAPRLLAETLHLHSQFLLRRGRESEAPKYAEYARNYVTPDEHPAVWYGATSDAARTTPWSNRERPIQLWKEGIAVARNRGEASLESRMLREMATYRRREGDLIAALGLAREAQRLAVRSEQGGFIFGSHVVLADILVRLGQRREALETMPPPPVDMEVEIDPFGSTDRLLRWANLFGYCGDKVGVQEYLSQALQLIERYHLPHLRQRAERTARRIGI